jgi:hypothetical protein
MQKLLNKKLIDMPGRACRHPFRPIACVFGALFGVAAAAQSSAYLDVSATRLPAGIAGQCMDAAAGDADGDGDLDLALAMEFRPNLLLVNDGSGTFVAESDRLPRTMHDSEDVAFADFDLDGDQDLVFVSEDDRTDELFLNDGSGRFSNASERLAWQDVSNALAVIDLDGDGSADLLTGNMGRNRVLLNDGSGRFDDRTDELWPQSRDSRTQDLELADIDADGDLDVVVANEGQNQVFMNADGRLFDVTERALPARMDETREIRSGDLDGDGDVDLVVANAYFIMAASPADYVLFNDGTGTFSLRPEDFPENGRNNFTVQILDLDDDGDADILVPDSDFPSDSGIPAGRSRDFLALLNDGSGRFDAVSPGLIVPSAVVGNGFDIEWGDFNGDGAGDLFLCNRASSPAAGQAAESGGRQYLLFGNASAAR